MWRANTKKEDKIAAVMFVSFRCSGGKTHGHTHYRHASQSMVSRFSTSLGVHICCVHTHIGTRSNVQCRVAKGFFVLAWRRCVLSVWGLIAGVRHRCLAGLCGRSGGLNQPSPTLCVVYPFQVENRRSFGRMAVMYAPLERATNDDCPNMLPRASVAYAR